MQQIEATFDAEANDWHQLARRYQTRYDEMVDDLVLRARLARATRVLDLGSGSGVLSELILRRFGSAEVTLLDLSGQMLAAASRHLAEFSDRVTFLQAPFEAMPLSGFDAVVSALALHHLDGEQSKRAQYRRIFEGVAPGGCFWQAEYVLSSSAEDSLANEEAWAAWLADQGFGPEEIRDLRARVAANDRPSTLVEQLDWLREVGFEHVDCTWRFGKFAVFGGWKPR